jgi:protein Tex
MLAFASQVSGKLNITLKQTTAVLQLLTEGSTIPFIARYRKDVTGNLDEVQIAAIQEQAKFEEEFFTRKTFIEKAITEQEKMTEALQAALNQAQTIAQLEDIYLPYKPKRKTKAQTARENGLQPLADAIVQQQEKDIETLAGSFTNEQVPTPDDALQGARDIIAETINENAEAREATRKYFETHALLTAKVLKDKETEGIKYKDYFDYSELNQKVPSHRALAVLRGFMEGFLKISIAPAEEEAIAILEQQFITSSNPSTTNHLQKACKDAYRRLLQPSLETESRSALKQRADEEAINVFAENLRQLLLAAPLGRKNILAIDPGYRTGCKVVCLDSNGTLLHNTVIYPHEKNSTQKDAQTIQHLITTYQIEAFAIGDGTAGRETQQFIKNLQTNLPIFMVNEDGASVYSASEAAREEFPTEDITVRGSVSIGRRLMDPLAELVKIDPKSIGVGQYQHDVNQVRLKEKLDQTVISCVNQVGVNLNTASKHLLTYVSGLNQTIAKNIIDYRAQIGSFTHRQQLKNVPRLGDKAFEQCAGFLRITNGQNILDASAVHPENYSIVEAIATDLNVTTNQLIGNEKLLQQVNKNKYSAAGTFTLTDILNELKKPGLDPRSTAQTFEFANIFKIEDVVEGMLVPGIVTNITRFGAFIDIGVKQDALVHVSEIAHKFITDPNEALKLGQQLTVKVLNVDVARTRIAVSIKQATEKTTAEKQRQFNQNHKKAAPKTTNNLTDALSALKQKFGK